MLAEASRQEAAKKSGNTRECAKLSANIVLRTTALTHYLTHLQPIALEYANSAKDQCTGNGAGLEACENIIKLLQECHSKRVLSSEIRSKLNAIHSCPEPGSLAATREVEIVSSSSNQPETVQASPSLIEGVPRSGADTMSANTILSQGNRSRIPSKSRKSKTGKGKGRADNDRSYFTETILDELQELLASSRALKSRAMLIAAQDLPHWKELCCYLDEAYQSSRGFLSKVAPDVNCPENIVNSFSGKVPDLQLQRLTSLDSNAHTKLKQLTRNDQARFHTLVGIQQRVQAICKDQKSFKESWDPSKMKDLALLKESGGVSTSKQPLPPTEVISLQEPQDTDSEDSTQTTVDVEHCETLSQDSPEPNSTGGQWLTKDGFEKVGTKHLYYDERGYRRQPPKRGEDLSKVRRVSHRPSSSQRPTSPQAATQVHH